MKKLLIATLALTGICFSSFAQTAVKKTTATTPVVVNKMPAKKADAKVINMKTTAKPVATVAPVVVSKTSVVKTTVTKPKTKPVTTTVKTVTKPAIAKTSTNVQLKKDGTPDKRFKNAKAVGPLKKDGTPDERYKANKKS